MIKPNGFDDVKPMMASPLLFPPKAGPVKLVIIKLWHEINIYNKSAMRILLDIAEGENKGYFTALSELKKKDIYITHYQGISEKGIGYYKGIIASIEKSNSFTIDWNGCESQFTYKYIGCNLRDEEYIDGDGKLRTSLKPAYFCSVQSLLENKHEILPVKKVKIQTASQINDSIQEFADSDLPF